MSDRNDVEVRYLTYKAKGGGGEPNRLCVKINAGRREVKHIVPPAGEKYAFDVQQWAREVEIDVSPTGRSVRVWVDGKEVK